MDPLVAELIAERQAAGITQEELAQRMGVTQATVSQIESHGNDPRLSTIRRYRVALAGLIEAAKTNQDAEED